MPWGYASGCRNVKIGYHYHLEHLPGSWKDTHELLERLEGLSIVEINLHLGDVLKISSKRGVVIWVEPVPRWDLSKSAKPSKLA
jgi:hypothetical protein